MNIYEQMANIIETRGKSQAIMVDHEGACCMIGAYALAKGYKLPIPDEAGCFEDKNDSNFTESLYDEFNRDPDFVNLSLKIVSQNKNLKGYDAPSSIVYGFSDDHSKAAVVDFLKAL